MRHSIRIIVMLVAISGCGPHVDKIAQICTQRMTLARDSHDSLSVLLACDQLYATEGARNAADDAAALSAVNLGLSAGTRR